MNNLGKTPPDGYVEIFCKFIKAKDGTIRYPKNAEYFHFYVKNDKQRA